MSQKIYLKDPQILYNMYPSMLNWVNQDPNACCVCGGTDHVKRFGYFHAPVVAGSVMLQSSIVDICAACVHQKAIKARKSTAIFFAIALPIFLVMMIVLNEPLASVQTADYVIKFVGFIMVGLGFSLLAAIIGFINSFSADATAWSIVHERNPEGHVYWEFDDSARKMATKMNEKLAKQGS